MVPAHWRATWRRAIRLAVPETGSHAAREVMGTTDVLITAALRPEAVVALGISNLYEALPGRIGGGILAASHTLAAQDTGADADANRDQATTQAALLAVAVSLPFVLAGLVAGPSILQLIGTSEKSARLGGVYLTLVLPSVPATMVGSVAASALRATGDTKTPMYVSVPADAANAVGSLLFGLGLFGAPSLGIAGIGAATLVSRVGQAAILTGYVQFRSPVSFVRPRDTTVARQLVRIGAPRSAAGAVTSLAVFPFNTFLLQISTAVTAGYQIAWRVYSQVVGPVTSGLGAATGTIVGQTLGEDEPERARSEGRSLLVLTGAVTLVVGTLLVIFGTDLARLVAQKSSVVPSAGGFLAVFGAVAVVAATNNVGGAVLEAGSETRIPFLARLVGMFGGMVGVTWLLVGVLDFGLLGAYTGQAATYLLMLSVTAWGLRQTDWAGRAATMLSERGSHADD